MIEPLLEKLAELQGKHPKALIAAALMVTLFMALGVPNIRMETDFNKELPSDIPVIKLQDKVSETYGGYDAVFVVLRIDGSETSKDSVKDIRDPRVMETLLELEDLINEEKGVDRTMSIATVFHAATLPETTDGVKKVLEKIPQSDSAFNRDYSSTLLSVYANLGSNEKSIKQLVADIEEDISLVSMPPGVKADVTGTPPIRTTMMDILQKDAMYTISLAAFIIFVLLLVINNPKTKAVLIFSPLTFGLIWTLGTMGHLDIPLSVATVGVGAMILGLGVEYGVFYVERYEEERGKGLGQLDSMKTALTEVGSATVGSSTTTIVGFLALLLASMPMMHHLGIALSLGIFYCVTSALVVNPALIVIVESITHRREEKKHRELSERIGKRNGGRR